MEVPSDAAPQPPARIRGIGFRLELAFALLTTLALSAGVIFLALSYLRGEVVRLWPESAQLATDEGFRNVLFGEAALLFIAATLLLAGLFFVLDGIVARPLRSLTRAVDAYRARGERPEARGLRDSPREIRVLAASFESLVDRVETVHKRDTEMSRVKSDFISTAAHQLRTPLTGIRWALEALQKEEITADQKALVENAVGKSKDLVAIVGTLLDISSIESGKYKYRFMPVDLAELSRKVANDFAAVASSRGVSLFFEGKEGQLPLVRADEERIKWVLNNIVENAVRYTPSGGSVRLSVEGATGRVYVRVRDTGIGIPAEDRGNIFERFYRGKVAISKENEGSGLGLYIARTIVNDHGGELSFAANEDGAGTTFSVSLPVA